MIKWVIKDCPHCGEKMVLLTSNINFRNKLPFNFHCEKCGNIFVYGNVPFTCDAKSVNGKDLSELLTTLLK